MSTGYLADQHTTHIEAAAKSHHMGSWLSKTNLLVCYMKKVTETHFFFTTIYVFTENIFKYKLIKLFFMSFGARRYEVKDVDTLF